MNRLRYVAGALALAGAATVLVLAQSPQIDSKDLLNGLANPARWLMHSGNYASTRHSPLTQITPDNVARLAPLWSFEAGLGFGRQAKFEATPIAIDGTLYVTGLYNNAWAIDGRTGKVIWHYERPLPQALRVCCGMANRGFAVHGGRLFMATLDAHVMALDLKTGKPVWDVPLIDYQKGYSSTAAPLVVKDKLIVGMAGGEFATRGFLDAYSLTDGKRLWRFNTVPGAGRARRRHLAGGTLRTRRRRHVDHRLLRPGARTSSTGASATRTPISTAATARATTSTPRRWSRSMPDTGKLRWHFQYTPHDEHDWDSNQIQVLADLTIGGQPAQDAHHRQPQRLLLRARSRHRRVHPGEALRDDDVGHRGRRQRAGRSSCPTSGPRRRARARARTWRAAAASPRRRSTRRGGCSSCPRGRPARCSCRTRRPENYQLGSMVMGGGTRNRGGTGALRAIDPVTMQRKWEVPYGGPSYSGVLSTASGLVFAGDDAGTLMGVHADTGRVLWKHEMPGMFWGAPSTVLVDGRQLVLMAAGQTLTAFALPK